MTDRILDVSQKPAKLSVRGGLLVLHQDGQDAARLPVGEVGVLVVSHPQVTYTQSVLAALVEAGGAFVICDRRHLPVGMLLPLDANYVQTERFALQARASRPTHKRLWQQIVRAKVAAQASLLKALYDDDRGIAALAARVRSGDPANVEAQASRRYWPALFEDPDFRRDPDRPDQNRLLNYGYAVLRAVVARAACAAGLHPSLGIHHHNRYNSFCLADDLMEPLRPVVDRVVVQRVRDAGPKAPLDPDAKRALIEPLLGSVVIEGRERSLFDTAARVAASLVAVLHGNRKTLVMPEAS